MIISEMFVCHVLCFTYSDLYKKAAMDLWIGLHDRTNGSAFEWVDGTPVSFMTFFFVFYSR